MENLMQEKRTSYSQRYGERALDLVMQGMTASELASEIGVDRTVAGSLRKKSLETINSNKEDRESLTAMVAYLAGIGASVHEIAECLMMSLEEAAETARQGKIAVAETSSTPLSARRRTIWSMASEKALDEIAAATEMPLPMVRASFRADPWAACGAEAMELTIHGMNDQDIEWSLKVPSAQAQNLYVRSQREIAARSGDVSWLEAQIKRISSWGVSPLHASDGLGISVSSVKHLAKSAGVDTGWYLTEREQSVNEEILDLMMEGQDAAQISVSLNLSGAEEVTSRLSMARMNFSDVAAQMKSLRESFIAQQIRDMMSRGASFRGAVNALGVEESEARRIARRHSVRIR